MGSQKRKPGSRYFCGRIPVLATLLIIASAGNLHAQRPIISSINPDSRPAGGGPVTLTINGAGFTPLSRILWNGSARPTTFLSAVQLSAEIPATDLSAPGTATVQVNTPAIGPLGGNSNSAIFNIAPPLATIQKALSAPLAEPRAIAATPAIVPLAAGEDTTTTLEVIRVIDLRAGRSEPTQPAGIAASRDGFIYFTDQASHSVQKYTSEGVFVASWGRQGHGEGEFRNPRGVALDSAGNVYVADGNARVQKFTPGGSFIRMLGNSRAGAGRLYSGPEGVAVDRRGAVYATEGMAMRVKKFDPESAFLAALGKRDPQWGRWGEAPDDAYYFSKGSQPGEFDHPIDVALDQAGNLYVLERGNCRVQKFAPDGTPLAHFGTRGRAAGQFQSPEGLTVDPAGHIWVADAYNGLQKFSGEGAFLAKLEKNPGGRTDRFQDVASDDKGNIFVADFWGGAILVVRSQAGLGGPLPKTITMAGFEILVTSYSDGATLENLTGTGTTKLSRDGRGTTLPIGFEGLKADAQGKVSEGAVDARFSPGLVLDFNGYRIDIHSLTISVSGARTGLTTARSLASKGAAIADLDIHLPGYATTAGSENVPLPLRGVRLEPRGGFYHVMGQAEVPPFALDGGRTGLRFDGAGSLVADFSSTRDFVDPVLGAIAAENAVYLTGGNARIAASRLFPVLQEAEIRLAFTSIPLKAGEFSGSFRIVGSDPLLPVKPGGYELRLTGGTLGFSDGILQPAQIRINAEFRLPDSVRRPGGGRVTLFTENMIADGSHLRSPATSIGDLEWGAEPRPFRLLGARGEFLLPLTSPNPALAARASQLALRVVVAETQPPQSGLRLTGGYLESPFEGLPDNTGVQTAAGHPALDSVDLHIQGIGLTGSITMGAGSAGSLPRRGKIGDFATQLGGFKIDFVDSVVTSSEIEGVVIIPRPADFRLSYKKATLTSTGEIVGPKLAAPPAINLAHWSVRLDLPVQTATAPAAEPILLASAGSNSELQQILKTGVARETSPRIGPYQRLILSKSFLRIHSGILKFQLDPMYGPVETSDVTINSLSIGADGQILAVSAGTDTRFLGIPFTLHSDQSLVFAPYHGFEPSISETLVSLSGNLGFSFGQRRVKVDHTPSGAAVREITPNTVQKGDPATLQYTSDLRYVNGYPDGRAFKEFLGLARVSALQTLQMNGLLTIGQDAQGTYEKIGLGLGADPVRAASLYQAGVVTVSAKLGAGALNLATGGRSQRANEIAALVGSISELAAETDPKKATAKMFKAVSDALVLSEGIYLDLGGKPDAEPHVAMKVSLMALSLAQQLGNAPSKPAKNSREQALLIARALDLAIPILEKATFIDGNVKNVLKFTHFATRAAVLSLDEDGFTDKDFIAVSRDFLNTATSLSDDPGLKVSVVLFGKMLDLAGTPENEVLPRAASLVLTFVNSSGAITGPDWTNVFAISEALLDALQAHKDAPYPDNAIRVSRAVLAAAAGEKTRYSHDNKINSAVKTALKAGARTLDLAAITGAGIPYDQAGAAVRASLDEFHTGLALQQDPGITKVRNLVNIWSLTKGRALTASIDDLWAEVSCSPGSVSPECAGSLPTLVEGAAQLINLTTAQAPEQVLWPAGYLASLKSEAIQKGEEADFLAAFNPRKAMVDARVRAAFTSMFQRLQQATETQNAALWAGRLFQLDRSRETLGLAPPAEDIATLAKSKLDTQVTSIGDSAAKLWQASTEQEANALMVSMLTGLLQLNTDEPAETPKATQESDHADVLASLVALQKRLAAGESEDSLKPEFAWIVAGMILEITKLYEKEITAEARTLWAVNKQTKFVLEYRRLNRMERIGKAIDLIVDTVGDFTPGDTKPRLLVGKVGTGLKHFFRSGGEQLNPYRASLQMIISMTHAFVPGTAKNSLIGGYFGLLKRMQPAAGITTLGLTAAVGAGIALAADDLIVTKDGAGPEAKEIDFELTLARLDSDGGTFWRSAGKNIPLLAGLGETLDKLQKSFNELRKPGGTPVERIQRLQTLLTQSAGLGKVGPYVAILVNPEQKLESPDEPQSDYFVNLLRAGLAKGRQEILFPGSRPFMSACPAFTPGQGVTGPFPSGKEIAICAIDQARQAVSAHMARALDPLSPEGMNLISQQAVQGIKQEALFAGAIGGENLSGIAGGVEYRNGNFAKFEFLATFGIPGTWEAASLVTYQPGLLTLQQASADSRNGGLLANLGLKPPGTNQLLGSNQLQSPIKRLLVQIGGPSSCLVGKMALGMDTPLGTWSATETDLTTCVNPVSLDFKATTQSPFAAFTVTNRLHLFYNQGNAGLDLAADLKLDTGPIIPEPVICDAQMRCGYAKMWGGFAQVGLGVQLRGGTAGIAAGGNGFGKLGLYVTEKDEPTCVGQPILGIPPAAIYGSSFEPKKHANGTDFRYGGVRYGTCSSTAGIDFSFLVGTDYSNLFFKGHARANLGIVNLGVWVYKKGNLNDWGTGNFPPNRYGGWAR